MAHHRFTLTDEQIEILADLVQAEQGYVDDVRIPDLLTLKGLAERDGEDEWVLTLSDELADLYSRSKALRVLFDAFTPF